MASKRLKELMSLAEEGNEEAVADIMREFPSAYEKIFGVELPKGMKPKRFVDGGEVVGSMKKGKKPQGVRAAKKGFGKAYMS